MPILESEAIPYQPAHLRGERLLVLAPHPDDEVIGCGGVVAQHLRERRTVRVVVATNGAQAGDAVTREEESRRGLDLLGPAELRFLRFPDRALLGATDALMDVLRNELLDFKPDLILVPSPIEIHPDHLALARAFCALVQRDEALFAELAIARVAFYEVGQPLRPNAIVDITDVADAKYAAIGAHESQHAFRDYSAYARGLNAYRAMTLPSGSRAAEAYFVIALPELRTTAISELQKVMGNARMIETVRETLPISVIVRTKDRPALLAEAIESIRANDYPAEIVVVNDGGVRPAVDGVKLVEHETPRGRSEAMNAGVRAASGRFIAFLDDDDLYYPEHLGTLAAAAGKSPHAAWYSDAVSAFVSPALETRQRLRLFSADFDRDLLLLDNYIPLPTLLVGRETYLDAGGFDPAFDLFEDWDFLIRVSQRGEFAHLPRVTCEIRHIEGGGSITLANPEGSPRFREAKLQVWTKHAAGIDNDVIANAFERQKRRLNTLFADAVDAKGRAHRSETELDAAHREIGRISELLHEREKRAAEVDTMEHIIWELEKDREGKAIEIHTLTRANAELQTIVAETRTTSEALYKEVHRLQALLDSIMQSRTWKLHSTIEKMRGRG
ncbi:MAG TPA: PIG-L family deacetylase [Thermoanaerobaculia bacterium]|nr:PIG-L family deacetylase [Thermoanaerobaculia bacterium]